MDTEEKERLARTGDMSDEACGLRLRAARESTGRSLSVMAGDIGIGETTYQNAEAGRNSPSLKTMRHFYREHRIDFNFLVYGLYNQLPSDVQERLFPALVSANDALDQKSSSGPPRRGRPPKQQQV